MTTTMAVGILRPFNFIDPGAGAMRFSAPAWLKAVGTCTHFGC